MFLDNASKTISDKKTDFHILLNSSVEMTI